MADEKKLYLFTDYRATVVTLMSKIYYWELTCLKMSLIFIVSLKNF